MFFFFYFSLCDGNKRHVSLVRVFPLPGVSEVSAFPEFLPVIGYVSDLQVTSGASLHLLIAAGRRFLAAGSDDFGVIDSWLAGREEEKDKRGGGSEVAAGREQKPLFRVALCSSCDIISFFYSPNFPFLNFNEDFFIFFPFIALKHG